MPNFKDVFLHKQDILRNKPEKAGGTGRQA